MWKEARSQRPLPNLCFLGQSEKQDGLPGLFFAETFLTSSETSEGNSTKLDKKEDLNVLYQVCGVFLAGWSEKQDGCLASDWRRHFRLLFHSWREFNETWQEARSQCPLPNLCFSGWSENKMAVLASDWLRYFWLLLWNSRREYKETWEGRSQRPLPSLCFSSQSEKQDGHPSLWLADAFSSSPLKPLNRTQRNLTGSKISMSSTKFLFFRKIIKTRWPPGPLISWDISTSSLKPLNTIQRNLTGSKISTASTKFMFFGPIGKTRWRPWPLIGWDIVDFFSETAEGNSTKLDRKEDLNILYQVCVFRADQKNKMTPLASDWLRHFQVLLWNCWLEFKETWQEGRSWRLLHVPSLCFSGWWVNKNCRPGRSVKKVAHCTQVHDM